MELHKITDFLDTYLEVAAFSDASANGLQVENSGDIQKIGLAVDACQAAINSAAKARCDLLIVHHGLFWGKQNLVVANSYHRIRALILSDMALYAAHLPLDAHPEVGNNARMAKIVGLKETLPFALYHGKHIGMYGRLERNMPKKEAFSLFEQRIGRQNQVLDFGPDEISRVGIVSGSATDIDLFMEVKRLGIDVLITGEPKYEAFHLAREIGLNLFYGGHYQTETFGVRALGNVLEEKMGIQTLFFDISCSL